MIAISAMLFFASLLCPDFNCIDGLGCSAYAEKKIRSRFESLKEGFNSRIERIMNASGLKECDIIMECKRTWYNSVLTIIIDSTSVVVADTRQGEMRYVKHELDSREKEMVSDFLNSKCYYRYDPQGYVSYDKSQMYVFYVEGMHVISVQCFDQPSPVAISDGTSLFGAKWDAKESIRVADGNAQSRIAYRHFSNVFNLVVTLMADLPKDRRPMRK